MSKYFKEKHCWSEESFLSIELLESDKEYKWLPTGRLLASFKLQNGLWPTYSVHHQCKPTHSPTSPRCCLDPEMCGSHISFCLISIWMVYVATIACILCASNQWRTYNTKYYVLYILYENECLYVICHMLWCAKWMFVGYMKYALVCKMNVCMIYEICFGVQNECCMYYEICFGVQNECCMYYEICFGVLSWTRQHDWPDSVTCSNCSNCNWKWAFVLTLYNTIAQKCYACTSSDPRLPSLPATYQPTQMHNHVLCCPQAQTTWLQQWCTLVATLKVNIQEPKPHLQRPWAWHNIMAGGRPRPTMAIFPPLW